MRTLITLTLLLAVCPVKAQTWLPSGAKFPNAIAQPLVDSLPVINGQGLINGYITKTELADQIGGITAVGDDPNPVLGGDLEAQHFKLNHIGGLSIDDGSSGVKASFEVSDEFGLDDDTGVFKFTIENNGQTGESFFGTATIALDSYRLFAETLSSDILDSDTVIAEELLPRRYSDDIGSSSDPWGSLYVGTIDLINNSGRLAIDYDGDSFQFNIEADHALELRAREGVHIVSGWGAAAFYDFRTDGLAEFEYDVLKVGNAKDAPILDASDFTGNLTPSDDTTQELAQAVNDFLRPIAFANLPSTPKAGDLAVITNAATVSYRGIAAGGGTHTALVIFDGTQWIYH